MSENTYQGADKGEGGVASGAGLYGICDEMRTVSHSLEPGDISCVFPREIVDFIIDHLGQLKFRGVLQKCCLVCRAWVPRVRLHLFRRVTIYVEGPGDFTGSQQSILGEFSAFLSQAPPSVTHNIHTLHISGYARPAVFLTSIWNAAVKLPSLHTLRTSLLRIVGRIEHQDAIHSFTSLQLNDHTDINDLCTFLDLLLLSSNLAAFKSSPTAHGYRCPAYDYPPQKFSPPSAGMGLRSLMLNTSDMIYLFADRLFPIVSENTLTSLSLSCLVTNKQTDTRNVGKLIRHAHQTLEHISLKLSPPPADRGTLAEACSTALVDAVPAGTRELACTGLNLDLCTSLVSFDLDLSSTSTFVLLFAHTLFKEFFSRHPEHVRILRFIVIHTCSLDDIKELDQTLQHMPSDSSTRVHLSWGSHGKSRKSRKSEAITPEERDAFVEAMPSLHARGQLYFHPDDDSDSSVPWDACAEVDCE
ncbi:uncharacterized protein PHACADRAFT_196092 [Phanerochaete carnosa HHB-10118-sp]|uniref:F-box domain-containing protein n=1 Tax=Phanerochaete carnosa (strain HHB-10118-sp) TaxID=650164 RepID=K5VWV6_PHACS|nr:uncharacterized protein PHACADRAFT_196092 [Phanerochaete carnosa HHB-10118-sp]EKM56043.1 hypothetical protein PHACADRAFT_196092 [Phanerochaete carnosa HHB-10118-sp]